MCMGTPLNYEQTVRLVVSRALTRGTPLGLSLVAVSCAAGAGVSFIIARYAARPLVEKLFIKAGPHTSVFFHLNLCLVCKAYYIVSHTTRSK